MTSLDEDEVNRVVDKVTDEGFGESHSQAYKHMLTHHACFHLLTHPAFCVLLSSDFDGGIITILKRLRVLRKPSPKTPQYHPKLYLELNQTHGVVYIFPVLPQK